MTATAKKQDAKRVVFLAVFICFLLGFAFFSAFSQDHKPPSLHLEDLTWTEVQRALDHGYDTVIIPTGGTEQNGPHMILGKHNYIARYNAEKIAAKLGHTLVAPVIPFVPEGEHMDWPGTIDAPEDVLAWLLRTTGKSMVRHGFKKIYFIGDSYGNQAPQERIAYELNTVPDTPAFSAHIGEYYNANGHRDWLKAQGFSEEEIGTHAGIADTSELMFIHPVGIRAAPVPAKDKNSGFTGAPQKASAEIGKKISALKVEAALKQIHRIEAENGL